LMDGRVKPGHDECILWAEPVPHPQLSCPGLTGASSTLRLFGCCRAASGIWITRFRG